MKALIKFIVTLAAVLSKAHSQSCEDLDHQSCVDLLAADPNLCQDATLAATVCPNTCNNCGTKALNCYHCETPVTNFHDCNKTQQCQDGEKCLLAERVTGGSAIQEYILQCATEERCNGGFGRRDVSTHCCSENLCNIPVHVTSSTAIPSTTTVTSKPTTTSTTTATTASMTTKFSGQITTTEKPCIRDIIVMVEDSKDSTLDSPIKSFLSNLVTMIPTGQDDSHFAFYTFDTSVNLVFDFTSSQTEADLISSILSITFNHHTDNVDDIAVATTVNHFHRSYRGDRSGVPNAVVIISDNSRIISSSSSGGDRRRFSLRDGPDPVQINTNDVIVINVGHSAISSEIFNDQAPDNRHIIDVVNVDDLQDELSRVRDLICY